MTGGSGRDRKSGPLRQHAEHVLAAAHSGQLAYIAKSTLIECVAATLHAGLKGKVVVTQLLLGDRQLLSGLGRDLLLGLHLLICRCNLFCTATMPSCQKPDGGTDRRAPPRVSRNRADEGSAGCTPRGANNSLALCALHLLCGHLLSLLALLPRKSCRRLLIR